MSQPPTLGPPPAWRPPGPPPPPGPPGPPQGPPPGWGPPAFPPPPRRRRTGLIVAGALALVLVAGLAVGGWLYATGRLGFGPLSAADEDAAQAIADGVDTPAWADDDQVGCAADDLVREHRSGGLEKRGIVSHEGDAWSYTAQWRAADATAFYAGILDCADDWADRVGKEWKIDDTSCLDDIGSATIGAFFAQQALPLADGEKYDDADRDDAVKALDKCYLKQPAPPGARVASGYRSVKFVLKPAPADGPGELTLNTGGDGAWTALAGTTAEVDTEEGGRRGCLQAQTVATYPWGSTAHAEAQFCGEAKPKRIWWTRAKCTREAGCSAFQLHYEGFRDFAQVRATYTSNGGSCLSTSGSCTDTVSAVPGGRGTVVTWTFPGSYHGAFVARVGSLKARIPN
ncbi:hypothetical protein ACFQ3F_02165 [Nocardioides ginsengisoli]|uniref:Uncharacterized protein n=1 Tax=Nocardioides ginsengisoli TaxID=363868 RepID=A0ABW3VWA2_9ACTN